MPESSTNSRDPVPPRPLYEIAESLAEESFGTFAFGQPPVALSFRIDEQPPEITMSVLTDEMDPRGDLFRPVVRMSIRDKKLCDAVIFPHENAWGVRIDVFPRLRSLETSVQTYLILMTLGMARRCLYWSAGGEPQAGRNFLAPADGRDVEMWDWRTGSSSLLIEAYPELDRDTRLHWPGVLAQRDLRAAVAAFRQRFQ